MAFVPVQFHVDVVVFVFICVLNLVLNFAHPETQTKRHMCSCPPFVVYEDHTI